ncbi:MAG: anthranilate synthase component I family protein [Kiritimatiellae bacterium]|nr:anthranilate synthase component I family protein [Kiritimatiellia bacterium]
MLKELKEREYVERAASGGVIPVYREYLADLDTPVSVLSRIGEEDAFLLESVADGGANARYSFLGVEPKATVFARDGAVFMKTAAKGMEILADADILQALRRILGEREFRADPALPPLQGGAIGYLAYDAVPAFEPRVRLTPEAGEPVAAFMLTDTVLVFDNLRRTVQIIVAADSSDPAAYAAARAKIDELHARLFLRERPAPRPRSHRPAAPGFTPEMTAEEFTQIVAKCKRDILNGECIQIVPSQKFTRESDVDAVSLYRALRMVNPSPYNLFLRIGDRTLIGSSPEELVKLEGRRATTCPIAGTRPRGLTAAEDAAKEAELEGDAKENAEHVMLVDLGRNDLGRVCETGSVKVSSFAHVEKYSHVMHLVSDVEGTLAEGMDGFDLLRAAFPAGTLTGAPKIRAMELLAGCEKSPRGVYGGAAGYFSNTGDIDFAIVIRTLVKEGRLITMRAGAGIVADSDPVREYEETINKSKAVFEAVAMAEEL